jgi:dTDP-glucose pyrophosphorylase
MKFGLVIPLGFYGKMNNTIIELTINLTDSIASALRQMDRVNRKLLIVMKNDKYFSMLSIGDIQRAIIQGIDLNTEIQGILRDNVVVVSETDNIDQIKHRMLQRRNEYMPIVSSEGKILDVVFWEDIFKEQDRIKKDNINLPVVIMAGGIGSRLRPLTNVFPKALIPIGEKTILEQIMDFFMEQGCNNFYLSVNHKSDMIKYYINNLKQDTYNIEFIEEDKFLGTAGSLGLLKNKIHTTFFVSNCDILVDQDLSDILSFHKSNKNDITIIAAMMNIKIPYGILETNNNGLLVNIIEKPDWFFKINTGLYILEPNVLEDIPDNEPFDITDLVQKLLNEKRKVGIFPVSEKKWTDMGNWEEFLKQAKIYTK